MSFSNYFVGGNLFALVTNNAINVDDIEVMRLYGSQASATRVIINMA
jgi:hypothetical protein